MWRYVIQNYYSTWKWADCRTYSENLVKCTVDALQWQKKQHCAGGSQNAANPHCSAEVHGSCLDSAPLKVSPKCDLLSGCSPSCCVFFIIIFASKDWLIGVTPLRTMKRECSLIAKLACTAKASKLRESCTTFKPRNFPETTMQLCHKTFD